MNTGDASHGDLLDRVEAILREVRSAPEDEREERIRQRCGDDAQLRREVESMLKAEAEVGDDFLRRPVADRLHDSTHAMPQRVGPWAVVEPIGAGGMGEVYRGCRADGAYEADVAIKFIRRGALQPERRDEHDRFLRERQILATLDHPSIARLLDGGVTEQGQPYLVMELVRGASLIEYCDTNQLSITSRLSLFDQVCRAVQHAHGKFIVHRDLKPSNILVDSEGRPRLLDFGIASMLDDPDAPGTMTVAAQRRFTPQYAAPEQVRGEPVTVATDVYALGMILYELLAGTRPYDIGSGYTPQDVRTICETDPPRPSRRLDTTTAEPATDATSIARSRGVDPAMLRRTLKGDLDHIVMTALRKEPSRRYATVEALREDLMRYRKGLPVEARPDAWRYRTQKFIARHRVPVAISAAAVVILLAGAVISTTLAIRINEQASALSKALGQREQALDEANAQRAAAERQVRRTLSSSSTLIHTLAQVAAGDESARRRIIDVIRERIDRLDSMTMPLSVDAEIATRQALAMLARTIAAFDIALAQNQRLLDLTEDRPEETNVRAQTFGQIGWLHLQRGEPNKAIEALRASRTLDPHDQRASQLRASDLHLAEALLMIGDVEAARATLGRHALPDSPAGVVLRERVRELESQYGVSLLPARND